MSSASLFRLLEEKEKDLELAAKIGQELLERNRFLDDKVSQLEAQVAQSTELITQLRHELQVKTDLLRFFSSDEAALGLDGDESSPGGGGDSMRSINVDLLQRKIHDLEKDNRKLQEEATAVRHFFAGIFFVSPCLQRLLLQQTELSGLITLGIIFLSPTHISPTYAYASNVVSYARSPDISAAAPLFTPSINKHADFERLFLLSR